MDETEIKLTILSMLKKKSSGFDGITAKMLKFVLGEVLWLLLYFVNYSMVSFSFAERLKLAIVVLVYKKDACDAKEN